MVGELSTSTPNGNSVCVPPGLFATRLAELKLVMEAKLGNGEQKYCEEWRGLYLAPSRRDGAHLGALFFKSNMVHRVEKSPFVLFYKLQKKRVGRKITSVCNPTEYGSVCKIVKVVALPSYIKKSV